MLSEVVAERACTLTYGRLMFFSDLKDLMEIQWF